MPVTYTFNWGGPGFTCFTGKLLWTMVLMALHRGEN